MLPLLLIPIALLTAAPAYSQTFCSRQGSQVVCQGDNLSSFTYTPSSRDSGVRMDNNGTIIESESQSFRDEQRRSEERRREIIYGDDRRDRNRDRDEER